jgi:S-DNA-T family DNA segregation ATPase FtsK/SpoIIIE
MQFVLIACLADSGSSPKGRAFEDLNDLPHLLKPIVAQPDQAAQTLAEMVMLMEVREHKRLTEPRIVIVIDELANLIQSFDSRSGGGQAVIDDLRRLVQRGREAGIHVIAASRKSSHSALTSIVKASFPVRLVGRVVSADDARVAAGIGGTGAERLTAPGDFIAVAGPGVIRFQAAHITSLEMASVARQLKDGVHGDEIIRAYRWPAPKVDRGGMSSAAIADAIRALPRMSRA